MDLARVSPGDGRTREEVLGEPLTPAEVRALVKPHISHNRQLNIGNNYTDCIPLDNIRLKFVNVESVMGESSISI